MTKPVDSLILAQEQREHDDAQLSLFFGESFPPIDRSKPKFHYTGERLFRDRPEIYRAVVKLLAEPGISIRTICKLLHVTDDTVRAVKDREGISIAAEKKVILKNVAHGVRLAAERVIELLPGGNLKDSTIALGVLTEKMQLLSGEATARIESGPAGDIFQRFQEFHERFTKSAEVIEIPPGNGLGGEKVPQKALGAGEPSAAAVEAGGLGIPAGSDRQTDTASDALPVITEEKEPSATELATNQGGESAESGPAGNGGGGEGVAGHQGGGEIKTGRSAHNFITKGEDPS